MLLTKKFYFLEAFSTKIFFTDSRLAKFDGINKAPTRTCHEIVVEFFYVRLIIKGGGVDGTRDGEGERGNENKVIFVSAFKHEKVSSFFCHFKSLIKLLSQNE